MLSSTAAEIAQLRGWARRFTPLSNTTIKELLSTTTASFPATYGGDGLASPKQMAIHGVIPGRRNMSTVVDRCA